MAKSQLKTSEQWHKLMNKNVIIIDPKGWDMNNFKFSFSQDKITKEEFCKRVSRSKTRRTSFDTPHNSMGSTKIRQIL